MLRNVNGLALAVSAAAAVLAAVASPARAQQTAWVLGDGGQGCSAVCVAQGRECTATTLAATIEQTGNDQSLGEAFAAAGYTCPAYDNGCGNCTRPPLPRQIRPQPPGAWQIRDRRLDAALVLISTALT